MISVEKVYVFETSGVPRVMFDFTENQLVMDEVLLSGFLSAIDGISETLFQNPSSHFVINHGDRKITLFRGFDSVIAAISKQDILILKPQMDKLLTFFAENYKVGAYEVDDREIYEEFRIKMIRVLFYIPICDDWIAIPRNDNTKFENLKFKYSQMEQIDGVKQINQFSNFARDNPEPFYELCNYLYYENAVKFKNHIEERDYVRGEPLLITAIEGNQELFLTLKKEFPKVDLIKFIKEMKEIHSVRHLKTCYGDQIIELLSWLFNSELLLLLDEERRKIAIAVQVVEDILLIILKIEKKKKLYHNLSVLLNDMEHPEILAQINIDEENFVTLQNRLPELWDSKEINRITDLWIDFARKLIKFYYPKYNDKLNKAFFNHLMDIMIPSLHSKDIDIIDPLLHEMETNCVDID